MYQRTLSIIKPDAVRRELVEKINGYITNSGLKIIAAKELVLSYAVVAKFYEIHKDRPFFSDLIQYMVSGPVIVQVLEGDNAVQVYRSIMGHTDPKKADTGTIRGDFAVSIEENCVHGSDSADSALTEIPFFFATHELII